MKRIGTLSVLFLLSVSMVVPMALAKKPFPDIILTGEMYNIFWEETHHPKRPDKYWTVDDGVDWSHTDTELFTKVTGAALHSWDTFEDYPSYAFVDKHVLVYDQESTLYVIKGSTMEYVWMSDWTLLHPDDVDAYVEEHPETFVLYHMKDYFIGVAKFAPTEEHPNDNVLHWMLYRQYSYWIQTEYTKEAFGFPEEVGDRLHLTWTGSAYVSSDERWQGLSTYFVLHEGYEPSDIGVIGFTWLAKIYDAFPETFRGFNYKWVPE